MIVYEQDRFRSMAVDEVLEKIRESELYEIKTWDNGEEAIKLNRRGRVSDGVQLWDGTPIKKIREHNIPILRSSLPNDSREYWEVSSKKRYDIGKKPTEVYRLCQGTMVNEMLEIMGIMPSFKPIDTLHPTFHLCYDRLTPKGEFPMERIRVSVNQLIEINIQ